MFLFGFILLYNFLEFILYTCFGKEKQKLAENQEMKAVFIRKKKEPSP